MDDSVFSGPGYSFGVFLADPRTGELRKQGRLVHLRNQPFRALCVLLDHAGELVTREEMIAALWGDNVDVDVEQGLNYCIREIRSALEDSADAPRFVQTLPRRGYRFLAEVRQIGEEPKALPPRNEAGGSSPLDTARPRGWTSRGLIGSALLALLAVIAIGQGLRSAWPAPPPRPTPASTAPPLLVVLPFQDLSTRPEAFLAEGLTDELIGSLGRQVEGRLRVIARSSALAYRGRKPDAAAFARELGASYFVEGTVRREGSTVRVSVALARADHGTQVWSQSYDRGIGDLLAMERDIVARIAPRLSVALRGEVRTPPASDAEAYLEYLRGRFAWNQRTRDSLFASFRIFSALTREHPDFALGWAGLADAYAVLMDHGHLSAREAWTRARTAAEKAVALDPGLAEAWANLAMVRGLYEWNREGSEEAFAKSFALNPNYATALHWRSILLRTEGRFSEAYEVLRRARDLDPLSLGIRSNLAGVLMDLNRDPEALAEAESVVSVAPDWGQGRLLLAEVLAHLRRSDEAETAFTEAIGLGDPAARAELCAFYSKIGKDDLAAKTLKDLQEQARISYVAPYLMAIAAAGIDPDLAFRSLEAAFQERSPSLRLLNRDPQLDPIRGDPRFGRLARLLRAEAGADS